MNAATEATWGIAPKPRIDVLDFSQVARNTLRGFVTVRYYRLTIRDCPVHQHANGRCWVSLPGKPLLDRELSQKRDAFGKGVFVPVNEWPDRNTSDRFSEIVIEQVRARWPNAFDRAAP